MTVIAQTPRHCPFAARGHRRQLHQTLLFQAAQADTGRADAKPSVRITPSHRPTKIRNQFATQWYSWPLRTTAESFQNLPVNPSPTDSYCSIQCGQDARPGHGCLAYNFSCKGEALPPPSQAPPPQTSCDRPLCPSCRIGHLIFIQSIRPQRLFPP